MRLRGLAVLIAVLLTQEAAAQQELPAQQKERTEERQVQPPPGAAGAQAGGAGAVVERAPAPPPGPTETTVRGRFLPPTGGSPPTGRLGQARLLSSQDGAARLQFPEGEERVTRGSVIGGDVGGGGQGGEDILGRAAP